MTVESNYGGRKVREGTVVSDKTAKTVVVAIESYLRHPLYRKTVRRVRRFMAHDEQDDCRLGDRVRIIESRPLSRRKRWRVIEVLQRAEATGYPREPGSTPNEFAPTLVTAFHTPVTDEITAAFEQARYAGRDSLPRYGLGPLHVHGLEGHPTLLDVGRDRVDHGVGLGNGGPSGRRRT